MYACMYVEYVYARKKKMYACMYACMYVEYVYAYMYVEYVYMYVSRLWALCPAAPWKMVCIHVMHVRLCGLVRVSARSCVCVCITKNERMNLYSLGHT